MTVAYVENIEQQHGGIGDSGAARFGNNDWVRNVERIQCLTNAFHDICTVFLQPVVHAVGAVRAGSLIVDCETAAEVEITHRGAFLYQAGIKTAGVQHTAAHIANIGNLGTEMAVQ